LFYARELLIPICFAGLLAMLLLTVSRRLEAWGVHRALAAFLCVLLLVLIIAGMVLLLQWQLSGMLKDMEGIEQRITQQVTKIKQYISNSLGISEQKQQELLKKVKVVKR
jgi:predicted PurR-regulated permease PerM